MKKLLTFIFSLMLMHQIVYAIPSGDDFYQNYFKIESKGFSGNYLTYWGPINNFINPTIGTHVGYFDYYSGANSQQWLIAPVQPGSDEFFIINKYSGNPIYVDGNSVKYNGDAIEKSKQIFKFQNINGEYCQITLASDIGFLYHKRHTTYNIAGYPNGYYYSLAYYTNKPSDDYSYFKITVAESISGASNVSDANLIDNTNQIGNIPYPPQLSSYNDGLSDLVSTTTIAETWVPFCLVDDPARSRQLQVLETPYYKLIRKQAYKKVITEHNTPGVAQEITRSETYGIKYTDTYKFQTTLKHSWSASGKIEAKISEPILSLSANYSQQLEITKTDVHEYSTETEITKATSRKIFFNSEQAVRILIFNLANIIRFERMDGSEVFQDTEILDKDITASSAWPTVGIITEYDPVLNKNTITDDLPPVAPQNLNVVLDNNHPRLTWDSNNESDLSHYEIWKKGGEEGGDWHLKSTTSNTYFIDYDETVVTGPAVAFEGKAYYKITAVDNNSNISPFSNQVEIRIRFEPLSKSWANSMDGGLITEYLLLQNYPNPFNPSTTINYQIKAKGFVTLKVYDMLGKEVATLVNNTQESGRYSVELNAKELPSGVYIYSLKVNDFVQNIKMTLLK